MKKSVPHDPSRRKFLKNTAKGSSFFWMDPFAREDKILPHEEIHLPESLESLKGYTKRLNLSPARWIWYPSQRTLTNTVISFRKTFLLSREIEVAQGWILGESRYQLYVNGQRVQFGPAPNDPRYSEADRIDLKSWLKNGENSIGVEILFYGFGDGTSPIGKPGFIFKLDITHT
ncbi:MAG: alpha-L-rhamnosidase, partial [Cyclobacteriaceae bacterium]|nr:alpha-L-rhamnosidase [Cyclobacteriaceae bacterium]